MNQKTVQDRLRDVFADTLNDPSFQMEPALKKGDVEGWDSFAHINLMLGIEGEFGVEFDSDEIASLLSVGQILAALNRRLGTVGEP
jgi:acyl carrier protein